MNFISPFQEEIKSGKARDKPLASLALLSLPLKGLI